MTITEITFPITKKNGSVHLMALGLAFLGIIVFPRKKGHISVNLMTLVFTILTNSERLTLVPMFLVELLKACFCFL